MSDNGRDGFESLTEQERKELEAWLKKRQDRDAASERDRQYFSGLFDKRRGELQAKIAAEPGVAEHLKELGNLFFGAQRFTEAIEQYVKALEVDPKHHKSLYNMGNAWYKLNEFEKAIHYWHKAIEVKPDFEHAYFNLGYHYYNKGFYQEAIQSLLDAAKINPNAADTQYYLAMSYQQTKRDQIAVETFRRAIVLSPEEADYHYGLGNSCYELDDFVGAASAWRACLNLRPKDSKTRNNLADALLCLNRLDEALTEIEQVLIEDGEYAPALCTKAEILAKMGRRDDAKELFGRVITKVQGEPTQILLFKHANEQLALLENPQADLGDKPTRPGSEPPPTVN